MSYFGVLTTALFGDLLAWFRRTPRIVLGPCPMCGNGGKAVAWVWDGKRRAYCHYRFERTGEGCDEATVHYASRDRLLRTG